MSDLTELEASGSTKIVGSDATGTETNPVDVSGNHEIHAVDRLNHGGESVSIALVAGVPQQIKVGASARAERKCVIFQPDGKIRWGFSNTTMVFALQKGQPAVIEAGPDTIIWMDALSGTVNVAVGEVS